MENMKQENQNLEKKAIDSNVPVSTKEEIVTPQEQPKRKSNTILRRLVESVNLKTAAKIGLATALSVWGWRQLNRSKEEVKEDSRVIREEKIPEEYPETPETPHNDIRKESADLGSRVAEWTLTGEYPSKPAEQIHQEAEKIREQIDKNEKNGIRKKSANFGSKLAEWFKGGNVNQ